MSGFPDDKFKNECLYAASYIAYEYCREYAYAVEEGLRLASIELKSQENVEKNCEDVNQEEVDIILQSVRSSTGNAIDFIQEHQLQIHAKDSLQNGVERTYKYKPDITMRSTSLNHRYHKVARKVIEYVFEEYQAIIETAKLEGLNIVYASSNRVIQKAIEILASTIHSRCRNFRLRLFELEKKVETLFTKMPFEQESVQNQHVKLEGTNELLLHQEASETIPEKRKQSGESATQAAKRPVRQVIQVFDCDDSSDDDFELMEVKKSINMAVSEPGSSSQSGNTKRTDNQQLLENTKSLADSSSKAQAAPQLTSLDSKKITQDTVGFKTEFQPSMQNTNFPNSVSSTGKEYGIDEILGKGVTLFLELTLNARSGLEAILDQFECAGLVQILKKGMSSDAEQLIVAMVNGEDISARRIKRMHNKGTQEGRISAMMLFLASFSERRDLRDVGRTQTTYRTFITLSKQDQNRSISTVKRRFRSHSKAAYEFLNAEETQNCEKLCIPIWTLNDAIEKSIVCKAPKSLQKMFSDDDHLVREVAHLIRCILVLICWTMQDEDLIKRMRRIFKLCKPFIGLNHVLPIDAVYISGVRSTEETAEGSTSGKSRRKRICLVVSYGERLSFNFSSQDTKGTLRKTMLQTNLLLECYHHLRHLKPII